MTDILSDSLWRQRFAALLLGLFAVLAAVIAAGGLCSVISYSVARQTRELGVRVALGAGRAKIAGSVLWPRLARERGRDRRRHGAGDRGKRILCPAGARSKGFSRDAGGCCGAAARSDRACVSGSGTAGGRCRSVDRASKRVDQVARFKRARNSGYCGAGETTSRLVRPRDRAACRDEVVRLPRADVR